MPSRIGFDDVRYRGSMWRIWDLHVHTPASLKHEYGGGDSWTRFLDDLRRLPKEISVLGINDYLFVDGYARVLEEHLAGNLPNIEAIFPVVELRLEQFGGTDGRLRRINWHVIFEQGTDPQLVESQFINGLAARYRLDPELEAEPWSGFLTRQNLEELGRRIRLSAPRERQKEYDETDLELGFNNLNVPLGAVQELLRMAALRGKTLSAVGKTEWASLQWNAQSLASKKSIINSADLVFTAARSLKEYERGRDKLKSDRLNDRLLDCSDAHRLSTSAPGPNRLGDVQTWINAEPTLSGLRHALIEFDSRVYVGLEPARVVALRQRPADYIDRVIIRPVQECRTGKVYFDANVSANPGFVAIVGNKGKGKSALLDVIGLAANSREHSSFSFLRKDRFLDPKTRHGEEYEVELVFANGQSVTRRLGEGIDEQAAELVTYIPQRLLDEICSPNSNDATEQFGRRLSVVLFAHISGQDRLGAGELDVLISRQTAAIDEQIAMFRNDVRALNIEVAAMKRRSRPARVRVLRSKLAAVQKRIEDLDAAKPLVTPLVIDLPEHAECNSYIAAHREERAAIVSASQQLRLEDSELAIQLNAAEQLRKSIATLRAQYDGFIELNSERAAAIGMSLVDVVALKIDVDAIDRVVAPLDARRREIEALLNSTDDTSFASRLASVDAKIEKLEAKVGEPARIHSAQLAKLAEWEAARADLTSGSTEEDGEQALRLLLKEVAEIPERLSQIKQRRANRLREIFGLLQEKVAVLNTVYAPARRFIEEHPLAVESGLEFAAALGPNLFEDRFWEIVGRHVSGTFFGVADGAERLRAMIDEADLNDVEDVIRFTERVEDALFRDPSSNHYDPDRAIRKGHTAEQVMDLLFTLDFLEPFHRLEYDGRPLEQLSPGQKGTLLLMFYLLVDPERRPLLIDQPDENLDNQTVKTLLAAAIKEASSRRQVLIVTHNPNVAVVADADQVVAADIVDGQFTYSGGAIEYSETNEVVVNVLEGTWAAFENRAMKYSKSVTRA